MQAGCLGQVLVIAIVEADVQPLGPAGCVLPSLPGIVEGMGVSLLIQPLRRVKPTPWFVSRRRIYVRNGIIMKCSGHGILLSGVMHLVRAHLLFSEHSKVQVRTTRQPQPFFYTHQKRVVRWIEFIIAICGQG